MSALSDIVKLTIGLWIVASLLALSGVCRMLTSV